MGSLLQRRSKETLMDSAWRYRGLALLVSVPVCLIALVLLFMPRAPPLLFESGGGSQAGAGEGARRYAVVVDAGSTGSRVHAFAFSETKGGLELLGDTFQQLKPGLSFFAGEPEAGAASLRPLLDAALAAVPASARARTPVEVRATAGLRLLPGEQAEELLEAVREVLRSYPFTFGAGSVSVLGGADEGAFQWLTLNYLLGNLGGPGIAGTVAAIDLGGGSVQLAHALDEGAADSAPSGYVQHLSGGGRTYQVYVHSYLGYGLMAARAAVLAQGGIKESHPCLAERVSYTYGAASFNGSGSAAAHPACASLAVAALHADKACDPAPVAQCGFDGVWGGGGGDGAAKFYVSSYFFDRASQAGVLPPNAIEAPITPLAFKLAADTACAARDAAARVQAFPLGPEGSPDAQLFCLDLTYCHALLTSGFGLEDETPIRLVKQVRYKGKPVEAAWPLGAAINSLGS